MRAFLVRLAGIGLLLAAALAWAQPAPPAPVPPLDAPVVDTTGTLDAATVQRLDEQARALAQRKGSQLQVLVVPTTQPDSIEQYAVRVFETWKLGRKGVDDGVLLLVAKDDRAVRIETGYGLEGAIPDVVANRVIQEYLVPKFRAGDFGGGIEDATAVLVKLVDGEPLPEPVSRNRADEGRGGGGSWLPALFIAFVVANVLRAVLGWLPALVRGPLVGVAGGVIGWWIASSVVTAGLGALVGLLIGISSLKAGRYVRPGRGGGWGSGGFGGGGWGGGGFGGGGGGFGGGGGWSGGGGMSGGGGASGRW